MDSGDWNPARLEIGDGDLVDQVKLQANEELDNFLCKVDEISEVIKALSSSDPTENEKGFRKADILLRRDEQKEAKLDVDSADCKVTADRSVINKVEDDPLTKDEASTQVFMKMVEKDANQRTQNRKERKVKSDAFRKQGNLFFAKKDFAGALLNYNEAIKLIKDSPCLYNNRALTYIRLGIFSSAIEDCQRTLELEEYSLKARMFMAKAHFLMGQATKCRSVLEQAREKLPGHLELIDNYQLELFNMGAEKPFQFDLDSDKSWQAAAKYEFEAGSSKEESESEVKSEEGIRPMKETSSKTKTTKESLEKESGGQGDN